MWRPRFCGAEPTSAVIEVPLLTGKSHKRMNRKSVVRDQMSAQGCVNSRHSHGNPTPCFPRWQFGTEWKQLMSPKDVTPSEPPI
jgi:hypothetical protein